MSNAIKRQVQETIFNGSNYGQDGWPPEDAAGFIYWFQERIERIPRKFRAVAKIEINTQSGYYGDSSANIEITYMRDETAEEEASRLRSEQHDRDKIVKREKRMLAELTAKYGKNV